MKRTDDPQAGGAARFRNREDAEHQVCKAIAALGRLAGIDVDQGEGPEDMDAVLIEVAYQSNFDDPHFLGGPCCFNYAESPDDVSQLVAKVGSVTRGLVGYIRKRASEDTLRQAEAHVALVDAAFAWLGKATRSCNDLHSKRHQPAFQQILGQE